MLFRTYSICNCFLCGWTSSVKWCRVVDSGDETRVHGLRGLIHPKPMIHFPLFKISPYFRRSFRVLKFFSIWPLFPKYSVVYPPKFPMTFFSHLLYILTLGLPLIFAEFIHFPIFLKKIIFSLLFTFPPNFVQFTCVGLIYVFLFPLFSPWRIYAPCNTRTGLPFMDWVFGLSF